jgi:hypothetical protein
MTALRTSPVPVDKLSAEFGSRPGLYACYASRSTWAELGLSKPGDGRPLYFGKAESTLASRDVAGHFATGKRGIQSPTGSSTLRRSLTALLAPAREYRGVPRNPARPGHFSNFGLSVEHDNDLSGWMRQRLRLALWPHDMTAELDEIETGALVEFVPPLNLVKVATPWRLQVKAARRVLADEARAWRP